MLKGSHRPAAPVVVAAAAAGLVAVAEVGSDERRMTRRSQTTCWALEEVQMAKAVKEDGLATTLTVHLRQHLHHYQCCSWRYMHLHLHSYQHRQEAKAAQKDYQTTRTKQTSSESSDSGVEMVPGCFQRTVENAREALSRWKWMWWQECYSYSQ